MNKLAKVLGATSLTAAIFLGAVQSEEALAQHNTTEIKQPYYNYSGYTSGNAKFILSKDFVQAVKANNVTINTNKIDLTRIVSGVSGTGYTKEVYDQNYTFFKKTDKRPYAATLNINKGELKFNDVKKVYGDKYLFKGELISGGNKAVASKTDGAYIYNLNGKGIQFLVKDGYVQKVILGHVGMA
ncbi:immunodominant staphylococcal antigen IsaB family protein [Macrococcoides canis]|uniref:Immunodominant staphylococcal antigen B n=1 Tax=Macrococcoides canis TaxID=1855823 RepID=A0A4R6C4R7_9STAP|nr:hypothetical protein [Macrococcus canis]MEE1107579.1 hypothetical protein [Macrococcus canis]TDM16824.1 hypothetical protein ETI04_06390 [Macrococcus canis]TDM22824.1 hypothetical protein ETI02_06710 [Macrococcus canis]TDM33560.1 hypothetical protein ETI13_06245 [Macrococcus canis]TDM37092.1 hypothetical protein ETI11_05325 [Macrococcus canis]